MSKVEVKEVRVVRGVSVVKKVPNRTALTGDLKPNAILIFHCKEGHEVVVEIFTPNPNGDKTPPTAKMASTKFSGNAEKVDNACHSAILGPQGGQNPWHAHTEDLHKGRR